MMQYFIENSTGEWVPGMPEVIGQRYRLRDAGGGSIESFWSGADPTEEVIDTEWFIDIDAFFDRFGAVRWAILGSTDPIAIAVVQDVRARPYVDLKRNDVAMGLDQLMAKGIPGLNSQLKDHVLNTPVLPREQWKFKRLYF